MPAEIERKFLVEALPAGIERRRGVSIVQGYLSIAAGREIRIRRAGRRCTLTVKQGSGLERDEVELPITRRQFDILWPLTAGRRIEKRRISIPHAGRILEIDRYLGAHAPLVIAEIEFPSRKASASFQPPDYLGRELTGRKAYGNAALAVAELPPR